MKSLFKRFVAFTLCVVMAFALVGDLGGALPIFAASTSSEPVANDWYTKVLALDVIHRSAYNNDPVIYHEVIYYNGSSFDNDYISYNEGSGIVTVNTIAGSG